MKAWMHCSNGLALIEISKHCSVVLELLTEGGTVPNGLEWNEI